MTEFTITSPVNCCELDESDLVRVNGQPWGASFFVRWAESPLCPLRLPTTTTTSTPTATATVTNTPTPTRTPVFHKEPWHPTLSPGYSERYNITLQNTTGSLMSGVVISDVIPEGTRFSDATIVVTSTTAPEPFAWYASGGEWDGNRTVRWTVGISPRATMPA